MESAEDEVFGDFDRILLAATGAVPGTAAGRSRVEQAKRGYADRSVEQQHEADRRVARRIKKDFRDRQFWRAATPGSVVDRLTVSRALAAQHPAAVAAYQRGIDVIRRDYDLDLERIGRDHRDLKDYRAAATHELTAAFERADTEASRVHAIRVSQQHTQQDSWQAASLEREVYNNKFWLTAGPESIADRVSVAEHLSHDHPAARTAYLHACDVLRTDYGISVEEIHRAHPESPEDRHTALRDALEGFFAQDRREAE